MDSTQIQSIATQPDVLIAAQFFVFAFVMVVGSYIAGWAIGVVRKTIRSGV